MLPKACRSPDGGITSETPSCGYFGVTALHLGLIERESDRNGDADLAELLIWGVSQNAMQGRVGARRRSRLLDNTMACTCRPNGNDRTLPSPEAIQERFEDEGRQQHGYIVARRRCSGVSSRSSRTDIGQSIWRPL
jgi:hypothetical protein